MKLPRPLDGAFLVALVTGAWLFMGTLWFASYDVRMRVPENVIVRAPQTLVIQGFVMSMWLVVLGGAAILVRRFFVQFRRLPREATSAEIAVLTIIVAFIFLLSSFTPHAVTTLTLAGRPIAQDWGIGLVLLLIVACVVGVLLVRRWQRKDPETASSLGMLALGVFLVVAFVTFGASELGRNAADDALAHRSSYKVVTLHTTAPSDLDNQTFFFVAQTPDGFYVRDLTGPAASDMDARFVPETVIQSVVIESRAGFT
ncbi:MAG: hypothetical protein QOE90_3180 [Thermoplasmata archaeon]|jgi:cytochrome c biogenesis factor|nr:hypothetical protein [Thermoplasmata archaeon]